jgi:hypothetical protein
MVQTIMWKLNPLINTINPLIFNKFAPYYIIVWKRI